MTVLPVSLESRTKRVVPSSPVGSTSVPVGTESGRANSRRAPRISGKWVTWFTWYSRWYIRRHFHSLRCSFDGLADFPANVPWVVYVNHASWWDPLVGLICKEALFPERQLYAPIQQEAVDRYALLKRMGFFGVEPGTTRGAMRFLRASQEILTSPTATLSITPQGKFADCRERPLRFDPGLGVLATRCPRALFLPVAIEYVYWEERLPEILVRFGRPTLVCQGRDEAGLVPNASQWTERFESELGEAQDALAAAACRRQPSEFRTLLQGGAGQGGVYDVWRRLKAWATGHPFRREHGVK